MLKRYNSKFIARLATLLSIFCLLFAVPTFADNTSTNNAEENVDEIGSYFDLVKNKEAADKLNDAVTKLKDASSSMETLQNSLKGSGGANTTIDTNSEASEPIKDLLREILEIVSLVGIVPFGYGVYKLLLAFVNSNANEKVTGTTYIIGAVIVISLKTVMEQFGFL